MGKSKHATVTQKKKNQERMKQVELVLAEEMQVYGQVQKNNGDKRYTVMCTDGKVRLCKLRGKFRGRLFVAPQDIVLVSLREDDPNKGDLLQKYTPDEVRELKKLKQFTDNDFLAPEDREDAEANVHDELFVFTNENIDDI